MQDYLVFTVNPNLVDLASAEEMIHSISRDHPDENIIGLIDGMTMLQLNTDELTQIRDHLTTIIEADKTKRKVLMIEKPIVDGCITILKNKIENRIDIYTQSQISSYKQALDDLQRKLDYKLY